jgi:hypothetical protein
MARRQLQAFFACKTRELPVRQQSSTFRYLRIEEAHNFIHQKASAIAGTYNRMVNLTNRAPSLTMVGTFPKFAILVFTRFNIAFTRLSYP